MGCCNSKVGDVLEPERLQPNDQPSTADSSRPQCHVDRRTDENGKRGSLRSSASPKAGPAQEAGPPPKPESAPLASSQARDGFAKNNARKADLVSHPSASLPAWAPAAKFNPAVRPEGRSLVKERLEELRAAAVGKNAAVRITPQAAPAVIRPSALAVSKACSEQQALPVVSSAAAETDCKDEQTGGISSHPATTEVATLPQPEPERPASTEAYNHTEAVVPSAAEAAPVAGPAAASGQGSAAASSEAPVVTEASQAQPSLGTQADKDVCAPQATFEHETPITPAIPASPVALASEVTTPATALFNPIAPAAAEPVTLPTNPADSIAPPAAEPASPAAPAAAPDAEALVSLTSAAPAAQPAEAAVAPAATCGVQAAGEPATAPAVQAATPAAAKPPLPPRMPAAPGAPASKAGPAAKQPAVPGAKPGYASKAPRPPRVPIAKPPAPTPKPVSPAAEASKVQGEPKPDATHKDSSGTEAQEAQPSSPRTVRASSVPGLERPAVDMLRAAGALGTRLSAPELPFRAPKTLAQTEAGTQTPAAAAESSDSTAAETVVVEAPAVQVAPSAVPAADAASGTEAGPIVPSTPRAQEPAQKPVVSGSDKPAPAKAPAGSTTARQSLAQGKPLGEPAVGPSSKAVCVRKGGSPVTSPRSSMGASVVSAILPARGKGASPVVSPRSSMGAAPGPSSKASFVRKGVPAGATQRGKGGSPVTSPRSSMGVTNAAAADKSPIKQPASKAVAEAASAVTAPAKQPAAPAAVTGTSVSADTRPDELESVSVTAAGDTPFVQPAAAAAAAAALAETGQAGTTEQAGAAASAAAAQDDEDPTMGVVSVASFIALELLEDHGFASPQKVAGHLAQAVYTALDFTTAKVELEHMQTQLDFVVNMGAAELRGPRTPYTEHVALLKGMMTCLVENQPLTKEMQEMLEEKITGAFPAPPTLLDPAVKSLMCGSLQAPKLKHSHARGLINKLFHPYENRFRNAFMCHMHASLQTVTHLPWMPALAHAPLCDGARATTFGALCEHMRTALDSRQQGKPFLVDFERLLLELKADLKVFVQADCTVYLNALYAAMCKTPAGRAFLDYLFGAQIVTKDSWSYKGKSNTKTRPMRKAGILDESNRVFALNICDDAGTRMFTSVTQCLNYYTRVKAVEKFGIHDETGMVRIAYADSATTQTLFQTAPRVLQIQLVRGKYVPVEDGEWGEVKMMDRVEYEHRLNLAPHMESSNGPVWYTLHSVITHHGDSLDRGHYTACVKGFDGSWALMNDDKVLPVTAEQVLLDNPAEKETAYVLTYVLETAKAAV